MDLIMEEEALHLLPPASPIHPSPIPSQPFPFLKLPREIRDSIYYYALLYNSTSPNVPYHCYFEPPVNPLVGSTRYWGTEKSTRLFRVNHQVSHEALELFFSTYFFCFPIRTTVSLVNATIRYTLTPRARSLIRNICFYMNLLCSHRDRFTAGGEEERRRGFEAAVKLLPNVKRVELTLYFIGHAVPDHQVKELVACALRTASPLRGFDGLILKGPINETAQRTRIWREVREALGCLSEESVKVKATLH